MIYYYNKDMAQSQDLQPGIGLQNIDYVKLLSGLSDSDGDTRKQAEEIYQAIPAKDRFSLLGAALCQRELPEGVRVFAAVLLRRLIISSWTDIQSSIPAQQLKSSCNELLAVLKNSVNETSEVRDKIVQVIAALGKSYLNEESKQNEWSEFIQFIFELLKSTNDEFKECAFKIISGSPEIFGEVNGQTAYIDMLYAHIMNDLKQQGKSDQFYTSVVGAAAALMINNSSHKECLQHLSMMATPMVQLLSTIKDESTKEDICQSLIEVAEMANQALRPVVAPLLELCIKIMTESDGLESDVRFSALELAVTMIENGKRAVIKKRASHLVRPIILRVLAFMSTIDDDPEWYTSCTYGKDDDDPDAIGESALDRISNHLGGRLVLPILMEECTTMLRKPEWQARHAALMAFSCAGEGCRNELMHDLTRVVGGILNFLDDPHPRVRYAACNAIGQMATDFAPEFENQFHSQVIPSLCRLLVDFSQIRVQAHSACAMINFFEQCPQEILSTYLGPITEHIEVALSRYMTDGIPKDECKLFVIENVIVALSSVADSSAEMFASYYEKFMPCLKFIIKNSTGNDDLRTLRGKAIECVSLIGMAVGKEKFCSDASEIMQMLLATQTGDLKLADDDPQLSYMMAAWARICRILGPDFQTYLPYVMEPVLKAASLRVEIALLNEEDKAALENNGDWESVSVQDQAVGIRTAGLEDKATACSMLVSYARELKQGFVDYVERTSDVLIPLLKFPFHDDVRCAAAEAMPHLLESAKPKGEQFVLNLWSNMFDNLIGSLDIETEHSILNQILESISDCIDVVGVASMTPERYAKLNEKFNAQFNSHFEHLAEEYELRKEDDFETESDCSESDDEDCLSGIATVIHSLFEVYKATYLPYFQPLIEPILKLSIDNQAVPWTNRQTALCIWDDLIEFTGQNAVEYQKFFLPLLSNGIVDKKTEIRQAALYGVGQLAQQNGPTFLEFFQSVIPNIVQVINHQDARRDDFIMATENGISAIGKILKFCPQLTNHQELLKCWIEWLPIWEDEAEVPFVMDYMLELVEQNNQIVIGPNSSNVPRLVAVVAEVFARSVIECKSATGQRMVNFIKQIVANPTLNTCLANLTMAQQKAIQEIVANQQ